MLVEKSNEEVVEAVSAQLVRKYNRVDGGISNKVEALEAHLFQQSVQMRREDSWTG